MKALKLLDELSYKLAREGNGISLPLRNYISVFLKSLYMKSELTRSQILIEYILCTL